MRLQTERACGQARFPARVGAFRAAVGVITHWKAVHPNRNVTTSSHDGLAEELTIIRNHTPRRLVVVNPTGPKINRLGSILPFELISDLRLITGPITVLVPTEENTTVGMMI